MQLQYLRMKSTVMVILLVVLNDLLHTVRGHGMLLDPPQRSSLWRFRRDVQTNYNDNQLFCGGFQVQFEQNGGKCGVCGDPWDGPRENEPPGIYAQPIISGAYSRGDVIKVHVKLTANHWGWFEFRLCPNDNFYKTVTQACLDRHLLRLADGTGTRWHIPRTAPFQSDFYILLKLPEYVFCEKQCVMQWMYNTGNSWGRDPVTLESCIGCGNQENFINCADVTISEQSPTVLPASGSRGCIGRPRGQHNGVFGAILYCRDTCTADVCDTRYCVCKTMSAENEGSLYRHCHPWPRRSFYTKYGSTNSLGYCRNHCSLSSLCATQSNWCFCGAEPFRGYNSTELRTPGEEIDPIPQKIHYPVDNSHDQGSPDAQDGLKPLPPPLTLDTPKPEHSTETQSAKMECVPKGKWKSRPGTNKWCRELCPESPAGCSRPGLMVVCTCKLKDMVLILYQVAGVIYVCPGGSRGWVCPGGSREMHQQGLAGVFKMNNLYYKHRGGRRHCVLLVAAIWTVVAVDVVQGNGRLVSPPMRSSAWRFGFPTPRNYDDHALNCGGWHNLWEVNNGHCGVCGDPFQGPRDNEAGGRFATGYLTAVFTQGQTIQTVIEYTANKLGGWIEFRVCPVENETVPVTQACLDQHLLRFMDGSARHPLPVNFTTGYHSYSLQLPYDVHGFHCVLQWNQ
ncbi:uncharacterized protein LOC106150787 [Lingula anatina]|uniref:Uncharacterized protein LOC106150787 n=1 Tax=Lingula anatina TaxID=7574 RepID=A0A2R2MRS9_LINAN|nr:uncharacterized protein LOC106150787 [Lingula anatina]|eukprot:XP_023932961.1 uncharacterized protein LOC106150787 [Lingula anatina]